jgi:hypothetical protein
MVEAITLLSDLAKKGVKVCGKVAIRWLYPECEILSMVLRMASEIERNLIVAYQEALPEKKEELLSEGRKAQVIKLMISFLRLIFTRRAYLLPHSPRYTIVLVRPCRIYSEGCV